MEKLLIYLKTIAQDKNAYRESAALFSAQIIAGKMPLLYYDPTNAKNASASAVFKLYIRHRLCIRSA